MTIFLTRESMNFFLAFYKSSHNSSILSYYLKFLCQNLGSYKTFLLVCLELPYLMGLSSYNPTSIPLRQSQEVSPTSHILIEAAELSCTSLFCYV